MKCFYSLISVCLSMFNFDTLYIIAVDQKLILPHFSF